VAEQIVHGRAVEVDLSGIAGFEGAGLEFYDDIAPELEMVEKEVEVEILVANLEMHLPTDKGETGSQLQKELLDVVDEGLLNLGLSAGICGAKKVEEVGVFEKLRCHVRIDGGHGECEVALGATGTEMESVLDLDFQDASAPSVGKGFPDVKLAVDGVFNALNDLEDMAPRQLRNRLLRNWRIRKLASEYFHCQQVARGEALHVRKSIAEIIMIFSLVKYKDKNYLQL
jgi:hypothetical protein